MMKILLIDDELSFLSELIEGLTLREYDCQCDTANTIESALDLINSKDYDVIICDMMMPSNFEDSGLNSGLRIIEEIETKKIQKTSRFILHTAKAGQINLEKYSRKIEVIKKPIMPEELYKSMFKSL